MTDPIQRALDAIADGTSIDWPALDAECGDKATRERLRLLADIAKLTQAHSPAASTPLSPPCQWGFLEVHEWIGRGVHGSVYRASDPHLARDVALKILRDDDPDRPWSISMEEGQRLARIRHPNVVAIYGADRIEGRTGLWMEFLHGETLRDRVQRDGFLSPLETARIGIHLCAGVQAIHAVGLLHRDIKAQNVVLTHDGRTVLTDLGGAQAMDASAGSLEGTPAYLAPEILKGSPATARSEVYALGVLLFFAATGTFPFNGESVDEFRQSHDSPRRVSEHFRSLPQAFRAVLDRALALNPGDRFESIEEFGVALARLHRLRSFPVGAWAVAALAGVVAVVGAATFAIRSSPDRTAGAHESSTGRRAQPMVERTVLLPRSDMGVPSRDGRVYPFVDGAGALELWDVATAKPRVLAVPSPDAAITSSIASPDGTRVAYAIRLPAGGFELRAINADATWPRVLIPDENAYEPVPLDWSRDGNVLLLWLEQRNGSEDLVLRSISERRTTVLLTRQSHVRGGASLAPDSRSIVVEDGARPRGPLQVLDLNDRRSRPLAGTDSGASPEWLADGRIFFVRLSKNAQSREGWLVNVADGHGRGAPILIASNIGLSISVAGELRVSDAGELQTILTSGSADVYVTSINLARDGSSTPPSRISPHEIGNHVGPSWSPDGRRLAYFTTQASPTPGGTPRRTLTVRDIPSGTTRQLQLPLSFVGGYAPRWCPDGKSVVIWAGDRSAPNQFGYFRVNVNGDRTVATALVRLRNQGDPPSAECVSDDTLLYSDPGRGIVARNLVSGVEQVRVALDRGTHLAHFASSPDTKTIAFAAMVERRQGWRGTLTIQQFDGTRRVLDTVESPDDLSFQTWTPDGGAILYTKGYGNGPHTLWRVLSTGGRPHPLRFAVLSTPNPISLNPDGHTIAYPERTLTPELSIVPLTALAHRQR